MEGWKVISPREVREKLGVSSTTLERIIADRNRGFPAPVQLGSRRIGYLDHEVLAWAQAQVVKRKAPPRG